MEALIIDLLREYKFTEEELKSEVLYHLTQALEKLTNSGVIRITYEDNKILFTVPETKSVRSS